MTPTEIDALTRQEKVALLAITGWEPMMITWGKRRAVALVMDKQAWVATYTPTKYRAIDYVGPVNSGTAYTCSWNRVTEDELRTYVEKLL